MTESTQPFNILIEHGVDFGKFSRKDFLNGILWAKPCLRKLGENGGGIDFLRLTVPSRNDVV